MFTSGTQGFTLTEKSGRSDITDQITVNSLSREIIYRDFDRLPSEVMTKMLTSNILELQIITNVTTIQEYYWKLPSKFLGDKVTSYGGRLNYTVRYVPRPFGKRTPSEKLPDVELRVRFDYFALYLSFFSSYFFQSVSAPLPLL